jgi:hypothetical protein
MVRPGTVGRWLAAIGALGLAALLATAAIAHHGAGRPAPIVVAGGATVDDSGGRGFHEVDPTRVQPVGDRAPGPTIDDPGRATGGSTTDGSQVTTTSPTGVTLPTVPSVPTVPALPTVTTPPVTLVDPLVDPLDTLLDPFHDALPTTTLPPLGLPLSTVAPSVVPGT